MKRGFLLASMAIFAGLLLSCNTASQTQTIATPPPQSVAEMTATLSPPSTKTTEPTASLTDTPSPSPTATETPKPTATATNTPSPTPLPPTATPEPLIFNSPSEALVQFGENLKTTFTPETEGGQFPAEIIFVDSDRIAHKISTDNISINAKNIEKDESGQISYAKLSASVIDKDGQSHELIWSPAGWAVVQFKGEDSITALDTDTTWWKPGREEKPDEYVYGLIPGTPELMIETRESTDVWVASAPWWEEGPYPNETPLVENPKSGKSIMDTSTWVFKTIIATNNPSPSDKDVIALRDALRNKQTTVALNGKLVDLTNVNTNDIKFDLTKPVIYTYGLTPENGNTRIGTDALMVKNGVIVNSDGSINVNIAPKTPTSLGLWTFTNTMALWFSDTLNMTPTLPGRKISVNKLLFQNTFGIYIDDNNQRQVNFGFLTLKSPYQRTEFGDDLPVEPYIIPQLR